MSPPSLCWPSAVRHCATHWGSFTCGGVSNDSPPHSWYQPLWRLHHLLVGCGRPLWAWLSDRCHLGRTQQSWAVLAFAGPVCLGGAIPQSSSPFPVIQHSSLPQRGEVGPWLLRLSGPREAAASICCSLWEAVLVGAVDTLLQVYRQWSGLLRRQSLRVPVTPLLPGSMTEGRLPCKYTGSPSGSKSGNTPTRLPFRASRVGLWPRDSLRCPGWAAVPSVQR